MFCYLAVWTFTATPGRRQEITMTFWANTDADARHVAHKWFDHAEPTLAACDFSLTNLSKERDAP
jgi:hypothetical protein